MTKFNVGDKVRFIEDYMDYKKGDIVEVEGFWSEGINYIGKGNSTGCYFSRVELVESKPTKNQRITTLENEVAELKLIVHELRDGRKTMRDVMNEVLSEPSTTNTVEDKPKMTRLVDGQWQPTSYEEIAEMMSLTPNQQRAEIIEKAKQFLETNKTSVSGYDANNLDLYVNYENVYSPRYKGDRTACNAEFIIVKEKSKVIVLLKGINTNKVYARGIAKCSPNDVFNEHIGKAIALGRALGLDVSEFEQAVQPTLAIGQIVYETEDKTYRTIAESGVYSEESMLTSINSRSAKELSVIINDTNAIYEVES